MLARSPVIKDDAQDKQDFALRPNSQPAPRTGNVIKAAFPAPPSTLLPPIANEAKGDLKVLRYMPEGEVPIAPELTVTFNQPMIAVTSQTDAAASVPVTLTPTPKGHWRWIGTRTVLFDPEVRFPQATTYKVAVAKGTKSATGGVLKDGVAFTFETPAPSLVASSYPDAYGPQRLGCSDVRRCSIRRSIRRRCSTKTSLTANGCATTSCPIEAARRRTAIAKNKRPRRRSCDGAKKNEQDGRWLAFRAVQGVSEGRARFSVTVCGRARTVGGRTERDAPRTFRRSRTSTRIPPLRIERTRSAAGVAPCSAGRCRSRSCSSTIRSTTTSSTTLQLNVSTRAIPGMKIAAGWRDGITINGAHEGAHDVQGRPCRAGLRRHVRPDARQGPRR